MTIVLVIAIIIGLINSRMMIYETRIGLRPAAPEPKNLFDYLINGR